MIRILKSSFDSESTLNLLYLELGLTILDLELYYLSAWLMEPRSQVTSLAIISNGPGKGMSSATRFGWLILRNEI